MPKSNIPKRELTELEQEAPAFTHAEHLGAISEGYLDAIERWAIYEEARRDDTYHRDVVERAKAQHRSDLESIGAPYEELGALADANDRMPGAPEYERPDIQVPNNDRARRAAIHGLRMRLADWVEACERDGIVPDADLTPKGDDFEASSHRMRQGQEIRERLEAMGENFNESLEQVVNEDLSLNEDFEELTDTDDVAF